MKLKYVIAICVLFLPMTLACGVSQNSTKKIYFLRDDQKSNGVVTRANHRPRKNSVTCKAILTAKSPFKMAGFLM